MDKNKYVYKPLNIKPCNMHKQKIKPKPKQGQEKELYITEGLSAYEAIHNNTI